MEKHLTRHIKPSIHLHDRGKRQNIRYNALNLPQTIGPEEGPGNQMNNEYAAGGTRIRVREYDAGEGGIDRIYLEALELENGQLKQCHFDESRILYVPDNDQVQASDTTKPVQKRSGEEDMKGHLEYNLRDHLGNTSVTFDVRSGSAIERERHLYYSFGLEMNGAWTSTNPIHNRYFYNDKEHIGVNHLNWQDYGARYYISEIGRWNGVDPLASKYPAFSPYVYCYNNPINVIDPDGREGIVVSGSPGDHKNRNHFLDNGLDRAKAAQKHTQRKGEGVTWMVYNDKENGYTQKQIDKYTKQAAKSRITLKVVISSDDIVDYVNDKNGGDSRANDQVTSFYYVGHSTPGDLDVGYQGTGENFEPDDFNSSAFSSGCHVNLVGGCRTAIPGTFEDSNVTQFSEILDSKSKVYGSDVRVYYPGGVVNDSKLVEKNKGTIVEKKGELPVKTP